MTVPASPVELPQLPTSQMNVEVWDSEVQGLHGANAAYFTAEQMRAYGQQCYEAGVRAERERCAKLCEAEECGEQSEYGAGRDACSGSCAAAIRKGAP